jgi:hypothetical protein
MYKERLDQYFKRVEHLSSGLSLLKVLAVDVKSERPNYS